MHREIAASPARQSVEVEAGRACRDGPTAEAERHAINPVEVSVLQEWKSRAVTGCPEDGIERFPPSVLENDAIAIETLDLGRNCDTAVLEEMKEQGIDDRRLGEQGVIGARQTPAVDTTEDDVTQTAQDDLL
jgi:hypothetical protein